ncbi:hypothetical protein [Kitasatospora cinereorecta]
MGRPGRPQGQPRGHTDEANALAQFLRDITKGTTVRELGVRYYMSKTTWSDYRSGTKLIPLRRLQDVIADHVHDPDEARAHQITAERLHKAAFAAEASRRPTPETTAQAEKDAEQELAHAKQVDQAVQHMATALTDRLNSAHHARPQAPRLQAHLMTT